MIGRTGDLISKLSMAVLGIFLLTAVFRMIEPRSITDTFKFDIKKAKEVKQRLSDVKGVDEIRHEIENVIKMVSQPEK